MTVDLPPRYREGWREQFDEIVHRQLRPRITVLDVGSGRNPTILPADRPADVTYVGMDLSADELRVAGQGAYDERVVADLATHVPSLVNTIDLAVSWQVLEHVKPLDVALDNVYAYLKPDGTFVALFSGSRSAFGLVNRALPNAVAKRLVKRSMRRDETTPVFPAYYDRCHETALQVSLSKWSEVEIRALFRGASYFHFSTLLTRAYLGYENAIERADLKNWATHYLVVARR
jgi:cyclopropane fatty-acyl-phospholipid synthase-like methyltransferase